MRIPNKIWIYWFITDVLLIIEAIFGHTGLMLAIGLTTVQVVHFYAEERSIRGFATQVRIAYLLLLLLALWHPMAWLIYPVIIGTSAMVLLNYCFLARFMSLMPWNHSEAYSVSMILNTFFSKPVSGSVQKNRSAQ
ncbi:hypothetical protein [Halothiobacillus sp.]|jgi:hypothetical protein|uniref:hypothetical protein n=1 Tax=Halothiobacillus sp. TaxID=1891311 RepID=UPI00298536B4|nr:hypothetical protein [Halothiobacillus sp.]MDY0147274.1 hypothetical protein [Halothiobacillus sp.]